VATELQKKVLQSMLKSQNVLGLESSYENKVPPMGAPKAALTPADTPAQVNSRLLTSFLK